MALTGDTLRVRPLTDTLTTLHWVADANAATNRRNRARRAASKAGPC